MSSPQGVLFAEKYRPSTLADFPLENHIRFLQTMGGCHLLMVGPSSCGKTSLLMAWVRDYFGEESGESDIMVLNVLKDQGIHFFRNEMKSFCQSRPSGNKRKKVVVIDDLDLIPEQSQQLFRNYMDKYDSLVVFVAVCANLQKVIESLQSRFYLLHMQKPSKTDAIQLLEKVCQQEHMVLDEDAKVFLVQNAEYRPRPLLNMLERLSLVPHSFYTLSVCTALCSHIWQDDFVSYIQPDQPFAARVQIIMRMAQQGYSVIDILDSFFRFVKQSALLDDSVKYALIPCICSAITFFHTVHENTIELVFFTRKVHNIIHTSAAC